VFVGRQLWTQLSVAHFVFTLLILTAQLVKVLVFNYSGPHVVAPFGPDGPQWDLPALFDPNLPNKDKVALEGTVDSGCCSPGWSGT